MWIDIPSVLIRALSFIALFQAAGAAFFLALFGRAFNASAAIVRLGRWSAVLGAALVLAHHVLDAGRMAGEISGVLDASLQSLSMSSSTGVANGLRMLGLIMLALCLHRTDQASRRLTVIGAVIVCAAFVATGHTSVHAQRWLLAPLLLLHVLAIAFWFGALWPLIIVTRCEPAAVAASVVEKFSSIAMGAVPLIAIAGAGISWILLPNRDALFQAYGLLLMAKAGGFTLLLALAALNKWRFAPRLASDGVKARNAFCRSVTTEVILICAVLSVTAFLTAFLSPDGE